MKIVGIISEYNPFHNGHARQIRHIRHLLGEDTAIVCAMSGSFVQRGAPAILDKGLRARAAVDCSADLVLELPVQTCLSSAEGFAAGGVSILGKLCDRLSFGCEAGEAGDFMSIAHLLLSPDFSVQLRRELERGLSFPAARQQAVEALGAQASLLSRPNNILAVEYCKAILAQNLSLEPMPILRQGDYHAQMPEPEQPSATSLRNALESGLDIGAYVPPQALALFKNAPLHTLAAGERAVLYRLRTMTEAEFESLPYGSEGLWRKLMHASHRYDSLEEILTQVKSKRYTRTRLDRMVLCAFLGLDQAAMARQPDYTRVLAFSQRGRQLLAAQRGTEAFLPTGQPVEDPQWALEQRCESLYTLFRLDGPGRPDAGKSSRIYYKRP